MPSTREPSGLRPRHRLQAVRDALLDTRVVLIAGPRQAGKSTLARMAIEGHPFSAAVNLDDDVSRSAALRDPAGFVEHDGLLLIDEIQRVPELLLAIKSAVDRSGRPGSFLLTGSADVLQLPRVADALPGRMEINDLWPFSQGELTGQVEHFVDRAFQGWRGVSVPPPLDKRAYLERAVVGGFPEVAARESEKRRATWFDSYLRSMVQRDLLNVSNVDRPADLAQLIRLVAARSGRILKIEELARDARVAPSTLRRHLDLLEAAFLVLAVPAWANNRTTRAIHAPKIFMTDSGLLAHLVGANPVALARVDGDAGSVLETFVMMEVRKQLGWSLQGASMHHFRTKDGLEVDLVLEAPDGRIVGIEVKAAATVRTSDFSGLRHLAQRSGDRFQCGLVLYTGRQSHPFGDRLWCTPISSLWQA